MSVLFRFNIPSDPMSAHSVYNIVLDCSVEESHSNAAEVTKHKVETGSDITDHVRPLPPRLSIKGIISNYPTVPSLESPSGDVPSSQLTGNFSGVLTSQAVIARNGIPLVANGLVFAAEFDRVRDSHKAFLDAKNSGAVLQVYTSLDYYENMVIEQYEVKRDKNNANVLNFTMGLSKIIFASTQTVAARAPTIQKKKNGNTPPKELTQAEKDKVSASVLDNFGGFLGGIGK